MSMFARVINKFSTDYFMKSSGIVFLITISANFLTYVFQIVMSRLLSVEIYGEMNAVFAIIMVATVVFFPLSGYFANAVARLFEKKNYSGVRFLLQSAYKVFVPVCFFVVLLLSLFSPLISRYISVDITLVCFAFLVMFLTAVNSINTGFIQGLHYFAGLSIVLVLPQLIKLFFGVVMVLAGYFLGGIIFAAALGLLVSVFTALVSFKRVIPNGNENGKTVFSFSWKYMIPLILANLLFSILSQFDVVIVKHYFGSYDTGVYSSAAVIGKTILYLPSAFVMSLFPIVSANHKNLKYSYKILLKSLIVTTVMSLGLLLLFFVFPRFVVLVLFGEKYLPVVPILGMFSLAMLPLGLIMIFMHFYMALKDFSFITVLLLSIVVLFAGVYYFHSDLIVVIRVILAAGFLSLLFFATKSLFAYLRSNDVVVNGSD